MHPSLEAVNIKSSSVAMLLTGSTSDPVKIILWFPMLMPSKGYQTHAPSYFPAKMPLLIIFKLCTLLSESWISVTKTHVKNNNINLIQKNLMKESLPISKFIVQNLLKKWAKVCQLVCYMFMVETGARKLTYKGNWPIN